MATRNPTAYSKWQKIRRYTTGKSILGSSMDEVIADQIFTLDEQRMVLNIEASALSQSTSSGTFVTLLTLKTKTKDMCAVDSVVGGNIDHEGAVRAFATDGTTAGELRFRVASIPSNSGALALAAGTTTPAWHGWGTFSFPTNDTIDTIEVQARVTSGAGSIVVIGTTVFAAET